MGLFEHITGAFRSASPLKTSFDDHSSGKERVVLTKGEIVKGEIIDLRSREVTVALENGKTLHAKLAAAMDLTIGQTAQFYVQEADDSLITLRLLTEQDPTFTEAAIDKALEAAGLPKSESAASAVLSLLSAGLPVNKEMIQNMLRYTAANKNAESSSITALMKNHLPVTKENLSSLESYKNYEHRLLSQSEKLVTMISEAFFDDSIPETARTKLLAAFSGEASFPADKLPETPKNLLPSESILPESDQTNLPSGKTAPEIREIPEILDFNEHSGTNTQNLSPEPFSAHAYHPETNINRSDFPDTKTDVPRNETISENTAEKGAENGMEKAVKADTAARSTVSHPREKRELISELSEELMKNFVLSPEELQEEGAVKNFYQKLSRLLHKLTALTSENTEANDALSKLSASAGKMQENITFMNTLNQVFPYVQLPLHLTEQLTHGELTVYTKKKDLTGKDREVSILLHLDMTYLGPTDVNLSLYRTNVNAMFSMQDEDSVSVIQEALPELSKALLAKGYQFQATVQKREKEQNPINDLLLNEAAVPMKRFRFDIRA